MPLDEMDLNNITDAQLEAMIAEQKRWLEEAEKIEAAKTPAKPPTLADAKQELRQFGVTLRKRNGEYRVNLSGGTEDTAYYTDDIEDAIGTGLKMATHRGK